MRTRSKILFLIAFSIAIILSAQSKVEDSDFLSKASVSLAVLDLESNEILLEKDKDRLLIPASTMKLVTSVLSLHHLGSDFQFKTDLGYSGYIDEEGVLQGDLILIGYGDPTFFSSYFYEDVSLESILDEFHTVLHSKGITCINGAIIVDASIYDDEPINPHWLWQDISNYYGGGVSGFNFLDNSYKVTFSRSTAVRKPTSIKEITPDIPDLLFENRVVTGEKGSGDQAYIFGGPNNFNRTIQGTIPPGKGPFSIKGAIPNPPMTFARLLMDGLENRGIGVYGDFDARAFPEEKTHLKTWNSPSLPTTLEVMNHRSVNLIADGLHAYLSRSFDWESRPLDNPLKSLGLSAIECEGETVLDGSGLSPRNMVSSYMICRLLEEAHKKNFGLEKSLPVLGQEGTLSYWPKIEDDSFSVLAKSGSMTGVQALAGYITRDDRPKFAFAIMVNNYTGKSKNVREWMIDQLNEALSKKADKID